VSVQQVPRVSCVNRRCPGPPSPLYVHKASIGKESIRSSDFRAWIAKIDRLNFNGGDPTVN
jgi:hypothetical protein